MTVCIVYFFEIINITDTNDHRFIVLAVLNSFHKHSSALQACKSVIICKIVKSLVFINELSMRYSCRYVRYVRTYQYNSDCQNSIVYCNKNDMYFCLRVNMTAMQRQPYIQQYLTYWKYICYTPMFKRIKIHKCCHRNQIQGKIRRISAI